MTKLEQDAADFILKRVLETHSAADIVSLVDAYGSLKQIAAINDLGKCVELVTGLMPDALAKIKERKVQAEAAETDAKSDPVPAEQQEIPQPASAETPAAPAKRRGRPPAAASTPAPAPEPEPPVITETVVEPLSEPHPPAAAPEPEAPAVDLDIVGSEPEAKVYTLDDLRAITLASRQKLTSAGKDLNLFMEPAQAILKEFGANKIPELKEEQAQAVVERFLKLEHVADEAAIAEQRKLFPGAK